VVFLEADDRPLPEALEVGVKELEARPECAFVFGRWTNIASDGSPRPTSYRPYDERNRYLALLRNCHIRMHAVMYRSSVFEFVGGFDTSLSASEDYEMHLRIARDHPVHYHGEEVAEYRRRHGANMTGNPALILSTSLTVHRSQRKHLRGHKQHEEAYKAGTKGRQWNHGLKIYEQRLEESEGTQESRRASTKERREVQLLRERIRRLERRIRDLDRQA
jgi:hypothetical protein